MANRAGIASLALLVVSSGFVPSPVRAADALRPIRTLVYDVGVTVGNTRRASAGGIIAPTQVSMGGRARGSGSAPRTTRGSGNADGSILFGSDGSIQVDVIAATADGGLVIDVSENGSRRSYPKVRVGITGDGTVGFDPKQSDNVTVEELALARWLARGFYGDRPTERGAAWTVDQSGNGLTGVEHYRVVGSAEHRVTLDYALEEKTVGADTFGETREGSLVYDTALDVPVKAIYQGETRRNAYGGVDTTQMSVTLTLHADSFAKKS